MRLQLRLRLFITAGGLAGMWLAGITDEHRGVLTLAIALGYWPPILLLERVRSRRDRRWLQDLTVALDLAGGLLAGLLVPDLRPTLAVLLLVLVATESVAAGRRRGLAVAVIAVVAAIVIELAAPTTPMTASLLLGLAVAVVAVPLVIAYLADEHRLLADRMGRLNDALLGFDGVPDLEATLSSLGETARAAVAGRFGMVVLRDEADRPGATIGRLETTSAMRRADRPPLDHGPSAAAIRSGETVIVADVTTDELTAAHAEPLVAQGIRSIVALPLRVGDDVLGALSVGLPRGGGPGADDLAILRTYCRAASLQILRSQAFEEKRRAAERLERSAEERIAFIAAVTHDLRTPLTTIKGFVDTVLLHHDRLDDAETTRMLRIASRNADSLSRRISTMLQFTKMEAGRLEVAPVALALRPAVDAIVEDCAGLLEDHPLQLDVIDATVTVDPAALAHVLGNLLGNAAKYSAPLDPIVLEATATTDDQVQVRVVDQGPGIDPADRERIFETFVRGQRPNAGGTGLGLAIAKRYIELSGGRIGVEQLPSGSCFWFTLPRADEPAMSDAADEPDDDGVHI